ncbi:UDP-N-acetylmuramoyl-L-alanine--D-glutamate ligase [Planctomicrobium sp. SH661]|uniref:UDP-N-acetylmuramoyl-L-alanine--D-glutamate ligase n=1 Tax=Planctomicrobium sp. SH661 TaxID=3448124 RepID=UPI003F5BB639
MSSFADLSGKRVTVMGLGQFGGGLGAVQFLLDRGARVTLTDLQSEQQLESSLQKFDVSKLDQLVLGEHRDRDFTDSDMIVVNPAVKREGNRFLELARAAGIEVTSEINLFWQLCRGRKIVVTGSTGKSTTATLIHQSLQAAGVKSRLGGNIGRSLLPEVDDIGEDEFVVLELSSFQLADLDRLQPKPDVAVVTNFFANHVDWHGSLDRYREAKQAALSWQTAENLAVLNADDADSSLWPTDAKVIWFGHEVWRDRPGVHLSNAGIAVRTTTGGWLVEAADLAPSLQTPHGLCNVAAALATVVVGLEIPIHNIATVLQNFRTLPHRLELVAEIDGRTFINDSKATTPEATIAALRCLTGPVILIAGGKDKGVDLAPLVGEVATRVHGVALIGDTATAIRDLLSVAPNSSLTSDAVTVCESLEAAVEWAWERSVAGGTILFSPACASHSEFANYERRGERFVECVDRLNGRFGRMKSV